MGVGRRKVFEKEKELMITKLRSELATAIAPKTGRLKSYSNLSSNKVATQACNAIQMIDLHYMYYLPDFIEIAILFLNKSLLTRSVICSMISV